jgi:AraC-like DNA-binding protein
MGASVEIYNLGGCKIDQIRPKLNGDSIKDTIEVLENFAELLLARGIITENGFVQQLLKHPFASVEDMVKASGYSRRQIQRLTNEQVGYNPHDLLRIIRFQKVLTSMKGDGYADQPHFIRDFKRVTDLTPGKFKARYLF